MSSDIDHFMCGYQGHFRIIQENIAKRIFGLIDERLDPTIFLVGVLVDPGTSHYPGFRQYAACVEPEKDFWIESEEFVPVIEIAKRKSSFYPESAIRHSHPLAREWHNDDLARRAIKDSIQEIIVAKKGKPSSTSYFVSHPSRVTSYLVSIVLGLNADVLKEYPAALLKDQIPIHRYRNLPIPRSFLDTVIKTYLDKASGALRLPDPISDLAAEEVLRSAANTLMTTLAYRADQGFEMSHSLFSDCNNIARTYYEKTVGIGELVLAKKDHPAIQYSVEFTNPARLDMNRGARKLLQLASQGLALHTDSQVIYGLAKLQGYVDSEENLFVIRFFDHHHWEVKHADKILMRVKYGQPYLPRPPFNKDKLCQDLLRTFTKITEKQISRLVNLIDEASNERHGTMLLISTTAQKESKRLSSQGTTIKPILLTPELLRNLTPIDGAVILNPKGVCYAIGTVLDGTATQTGNPERGARYNSAIRYVATSKSPCMAIVVSEDGGVDFFSGPKDTTKESKIRKPMASRKKARGSTDQPSSQH